MVEVVESGFLHQIKGEGDSREFPDTELRNIKSAIKQVSDTAFVDSAHDDEVTILDAVMADRLPEYEYEGPNENNPECQLWRDEFFHSVDLYHPEKRIAIEVEKSERKYIWKDLAKFSRGGKTYKSRREKIEFGCLVVPVNYSGGGNIFQGAMTILDFMRPMLFVKDVAVIGYREPR
jgi:hypothetical protein